MLARTLEPEEMDSADEAECYDQMDHAAVNQTFVDDLLAGGDVGETILDLGTGTGLIPIVLCDAVEDCQVMAIDAAASMLHVARHNVINSGHERRIELMQADAKNIRWLDDPFDCFISNSLVHHLPDPAPALAEGVRLVKEGGRIFVRDLMRPETAEKVEEFVRLYTGDENDFAQQLFRQSLHAALSLDEIREIVVALGFAAHTVQATSDRHWTWDATKAGS